MSLESLLKSNNIKVLTKRVELDYSNLDPEYAELSNKIKERQQFLLEESQFESEEIIKKAEGEAENIIQNAQKKSSELIAIAEEESVKIHDLKKNELENYLQQDQRDLEQAKDTFEQEKKIQEKEFALYKEQVTKKIEQQVWSELREQVEGKIEVDYIRLIDQVHEILNAAIERRREMLGQTEKEISELVILIAHKVVKVFSEKDNNVVVQNIVHTLEKLKGREKFLIRINSKNLDGLQEYIPKIKEQLEIEGKITLVEDTKVDVGGCIIETEFGEIDARISTQLAEIEKKIRDSELVQNVKY